MSYAGRRWVANGAAFGGLAAAFLLLRFPPEKSAFYPRCPVFSLFHVLCPGCGGTRALAALLHGDLAGALHWNALIVLLLPFACWFFSVCYWRANFRKEFSWPAIPGSWIVVCQALALIFAVARNLYPI